MEKIIISLFFLILFPLSILAQEVGTSTGTFMLIQKDQQAPFAGVLFDPLATATILSDKEHEQKEFQLKLEFELEKQDKKLQLEIDKLNLTLNSNKTTSEQILQVKDKEIQKLQGIISKNSSDPILYLGIGTGIGILLTISIIFAYNEIQDE